MPADEFEQRGWTVFDASKLDEYGAELRSLLEV